MLKTQLTIGQKILKLKWKRDLSIVLSSLIIVQWKMLKQKQKKFI